MMRLKSKNFRFVMKIQREWGNNIYWLINQMRNGHRRTQSDNYIAISSTERLQFKLYFKQNSNHISNLLKKSNRTNFSKTVCVESLDLPSPKSCHNLAFLFGRKELLSPTAPSIRHGEEGLSPIFEKKPSSHRSLKKYPDSNTKTSSQSKYKFNKSILEQKSEFSGCRYSATTSSLKFSNQTNPQSKCGKKEREKTKEGSSKLIKSSRLRMKKTLS